ncbi:MAG: hypothetical protein AAF637_18785 [Pseudomonadota bacterium]
MEALVARWSCLILACMLSACAAFLPPKPYYGETEGTLAVPYDSAWQRAVAVFATNNIPISVLDKSSGYIAANDVIVMENGRYSTRPPYLDCGGGILAVYGSFVANITVLLEAVAPDQTSFRINVTGKVFYKDNPDGSKRDPATKQCQSTGGFETTFLDSLRR